MTKKQARAILKIKAKEIGWNHRYKNKDSELMGIRTKELLNWVIKTIYAQDRIWFGAYGDHAKSNFVELLNALGLLVDDYENMRDDLPDLEWKIRDFVTALR